MKVILIPGCKDCPYGAMFVLDGSEYLCSQLTKINKTPEKPLVDCPLHEFQEVLEALVKD